MEGTVRGTMDACFFSPKLGKLCLLQSNPLESVKHNKNNLLFILNPKIESGHESFIVFVKVSSLSLVVCTNFPFLKLKLE